MTTLRRWLPVGLVLLLSLAVVGCSGGQAGSGDSGSSTPKGTTGGPTVTERNLAFDPAQLEVAIGDTVTFTNADSAPHNVEIDGRQLGQQQSGASVTWTASKAGTFPYRCTIHPSMTGEITVK